MPFYINHSNGLSLTTVKDGSVNDTATSLALVGKNFPLYGQALNQNFVKLLENFSSVTPPINPQPGQLWHDAAHSRMMFYRVGALNTGWHGLASLNNGDAPTDPQQSDLWYDSTNKQLKVYDGTAWIVVGPQFTQSGTLRVSGNNSFRLQVAGNDFMVVDPLGNFTLPSQPAFHGSGNADSATVTTADKTMFGIWKPAAVQMNVSACFNAGTGVFTCPASGIYQVHAQVKTLGGGTHIIAWFHNAADSGITSENKHDTASNHTLTCGGLIQAAAGDLIELVAATDSSASISAVNSSMSIRLVG